MALAGELNPALMDIVRRAGEEILQGLQFRLCGSRPNKTIRH
jgi:hypothetical protein